MHNEHHRSTYIALYLVIFATRLSHSWQIALGLVGLVLLVSGIFVGQADDVQRARMAAKEEGNVGETVALDPLTPSASAPSAAQIRSKYDV